MTATTDDYLQLITSQHRDRPKFAAMLRLLGDPLVANQNTALNLQQLYDLDVAVGSQLDTLGKWIGLPRQLQTPLAGVYFAWDDPALGWDLGAWKGLGDPDTGVVTLDNETYRLYLRAKIGANHWDGSDEQWQQITNYIFAGTGTVVSYSDNQDMSMDVLITGTMPSALTQGLIKQGYLTLKPAGVRINHYYVSSVPGAPIFAWDALPGSSFAGWDAGAWATPL